MREDLNNWAGNNNKGLAGLFANQTLHHPTSSQNSASSQATTLGHQNQHQNHHHQQHQQQQQQQQLQHYFSAIPSSNLQHQLLLNQMGSQNLINNNSSSNNNNHQQQQQLQHYFNATPATTLQHQLLLNQMSTQNLVGSSNGQQPQQQQQLQHQLFSSNNNNHHNQQAAAYNMNSSDYSSSTYHVYDQILGDQIIDDLIVIKQERMKKKLEQENRRKVILFSLAVILLVGLLMFLIVQLFKATSAPSTLIQQQQTATLPSQVTQQQQQPIDSLSLPRIDTNTNNNDPRPQLIDKGSSGYRDHTRTPWAPSMVGQSNSENNWQYPNRITPSGNRPVTFPAPVANPFDIMPQSPFVPTNPNSWPPQFIPSPQRPAVMPMQPSTSTTQQPPFMVLQQQQQQQQQQPLRPLLQQQQQQQQQQQPPQASPTTPPPPPPALPSVPSQPRLFPGDNNNSNNNNIRGCHGKHCSPVTGCPNQCSGRGQCVKIALPSSGQQENLWPFQHLSQQQQQEWRCQCPAGSTGDDCGILIERQCDDGIDNDKDGLIDCADSECCGDLVCQNSTLCMKSPDPLDILMRKPPLPPTSSFFQRTQFLIEKYSSQIYSNPKDFNDSSLASSRNVDRASVIRGRVMYQKQGVTGVRVSIVGQTNLGITLSRDGGYFDLMVNGGGAIVVEFKREPFATLEKTIRVPWNEIVLMDSVELQLASTAQAQAASQQDSSSSSSSTSSSSTTTAYQQSTSRQQISTQALLPEPEAPTCSAHNYQLMRPQIMAAPRSSRPATVASSARFNSNSHYASNKQAPRAVILRDSAMVQQSIVLPQSSSSPQSNDSVSLVYISSKAREFMSTISIQLTPPISSQQQADALKLISEELKQIHLKIVIEGILFEQSFEPQMNLSFTYAWNRQNVYRQKSFGLSTASVSVGYEYTDCKRIIWSTKRVQLAGHDLSISDIGSQWNLNIHHRYNYRDSILQRGDGQNFNLRTDKPLVAQPVMGDGYPRQSSCPFCDGATSPSEQRLLKPQALVSAPDGSLYVGDYNMIRRIEPSPSGTIGTGMPTGMNGGASVSGNQAERAVRTVLELASNVPEKYSLALNLAPADAPQLHLVDTSRHQVLLIREQRPSSSGNNNNADSTTNETTPPSSSQLATATGSSSGHQPEDSLVPVVGTGDKCSPDDQLSCGDGHPAQLARLIEPRAAAFDLAGRMYIADGPNVRMVDLDQKIYTILGDYSSPTAARQQHHHAHHQMKFPCTGEPIPMHKFLPRAPQDLAFNPIDETLHILDENVVYKITQDKRIQVVAGRPAHCLSQQQQQQQQQQVRPAQRATEVSLQQARTIAFNQNGELFIGEEDASQSTGRVLQVSPEDDTISLYAGQPNIDAAGSQPIAESHQQQQQQQQQSDPQVLGTTKQRSSNALHPMGQATRASEHKFSSIAAIAIDQQGNLLVADRLQLRLLSIEPDLPQMNAAGEYEIQSPDQPDELLIFNRHGLHVATRELTTSVGLMGPGQLTGASAQRNSNSKYTFAYNVNTSYGQLASVSYANGNKISIYRDGPHHSVKMIETASGGQCKLDISRNGQVHSIATISPNSSKTSMVYHSDGGLLKQSRDQATGEQFDFSYDEFGRATAIQHSSPRLPAQVECRLNQLDTSSYASSMNGFIRQQCASLIVAE